VFQLQDWSITLNATVNYFGKILKRRRKKRVGVTARIPQQPTTTNALDY